MVSEHRKGDEVGNRALYGAGEGTLEGRWSRPATPTEIYIADGESVIG